MGGFLQSCAFRGDPGKTPHMNRESWMEIFAHVWPIFLGGVGNEAAR